MLVHFLETQFGCIFCSPRLDGGWIVWVIGLFGWFGLFGLDCLVVLFCLFVCYVFLGLCCFMFFQIHSHILGISWNYGPHVLGFVEFMTFIAWCLLVLLSLLRGHVLVGTFTADDRFCLPDFIYASGHCLFEVSK